MFDDNNKNKEIELLPHQSSQKKDGERLKSREKITYSHPLKVEKGKEGEVVKTGGVWQKILNFFRGKSKESALDWRSMIRKTSRPLDKLYSRPTATLDKSKDNNFVSPQPEQQPAKTTLPEQESATRTEKETAAKDATPFDLLNRMKKIVNEKEGAAEEQDASEGKAPVKKQVGFQYDINLIREEFVPTINIKKILITLLLTSLLAVLVIVFIYFVVDFVKLSRAKKIQELQAELKQTEQLLANRQDDLAKIQSYYNTYQRIKFLLDKHLYWTNLLEFIEDNTMATVYYESVRASRSGVVDLSAKAKDYGSVWRQYEIFKKSPAVARVEIKGAGLDSELEEEAMQEILSVSATSSTTSTANIITYTKQQKLLRDILGRMPVQFNITLVVKPELFYRDSKGEKVAIKDSNK